MKKVFNFLVIFLAVSMQSVFADGGKDVSYFDRVFERAVAMNATVVSNAVNVINSIDVFKSNLNFWRFGRGENLNEEGVSKKSEKSRKSEAEVYGGKRKRGEKKMLIWKMKKVEMIKK